MDISHCYPNTKEKYIRNFFAENFEVSDEVLDLLIKLTTYNGYLPTGAPTSTILLCFAHKEVFDIIYKTMQKHGVDMTVYVDDITLSTHGHIGNWVIKYINNALKRHGLFLKKAKTKRYGFRHSVITGVHTAQSRKMSAPFSVGHSVITTINGKNLAQMSITELQSIVSKISYIQQFTPGKMVVIKNKAIRQIKKLQKENFFIYGADMEGTDYRKIDYKGKIAIVIGNEGKGLSRLTEENCDFIAKIPMYGKVNSLNASVAAALVIYEAVMNR